MSNVIYPIMAQLNSKTLVIIAAILIVAGLIAVIKKVIKLGFIIVVISLLIFALAPSAKTFQEKYSFKVNDDMAYITVNGSSYIINADEITSMKINDNKGNGYKVMFNDGSDNESITIPSFMCPLFTSFASKYNINTTIDN